MSPVKDSRRRFVVEFVGAPLPELRERFVLSGKAGSGIYWQICQSLKRIPDISDPQKRESDISDTLKRGSVVWIPLLSAVSNVGKSDF